MTLTLDKGKGSLNELWVNQGKGFVNELWWVSKG